MAKIFIICSAFILAMVGLSSSQTLPSPAAPNAFQAGINPYNPYNPYNPNPYNPYNPYNQYNPYNPNPYNPYQNQIYQPGQNALPGRNAQVPTA
ncbi:sporozoite surface protein 2-like [Harmonia axyridis]|uniref:sporozoite surface protein 2-like n=1 Tax=Harmonia axyridis TaxID=115357 RepID=UPI001E2783D4|nr:sporozoite surface protein 2-like [Harmonia axyridis]